jgi:CheY-like chemotaxis protein
LIIMARILFVDDDPFTLETLRRSVELFGHQAILASTGQEAETMLTKQSLDLILTDMRLPDMDGLSLVRRLKASSVGGGVPIVVLSASAELDAGELSRAAGAEEFLEKPVRLETLQEVIKRYTGE